MKSKHGLAAAAIVLGALLLAGSLVWSTMHTEIRLWFWDKIAERPVSEGDQVKIASCSPLSFWTLLKVVQSDMEVACGEAWLVRELADKLNSEDRAHWLALRVDNDNAPAGLRIRGAVALALAKFSPPAEPAWMLDALPAIRQAQWLRAATESDEVALHLGPALRTLGIASRVREDLTPGAPALPALEWLAWVDDPAAEVAATSTATQVAGVFPEIVEQVRGRAASGRPVSGSVARWRSLITQHPECGTRCGPLFVAILERTLTDQALEEGTPLPPEPTEHPDLAQILTALGAPSQERRAVAYGWSALVEWVTASPSPAERLRSYARRPTGSVGSLAQVPWDGVAPPFLAALVVNALGAAVDVPVDVRVGEKGEVWLEIGGVSIVRSCGEEGGRPEGSPWPDDAILAAALTEWAASEKDPTRGLRLATAAERIDPMIGGPLAVRLASGAAPELESGRRIGVSLLRPVSPPVGADSARRRMGERGPTICP
jgi:hypothetical protein